MRRLAALALLLLAASAPPAAAEGPALRSVTVEGTDFRVALSDGRVLRGADLVGAELDLGAAGPLRIAAARPDPRDPRGEVWLFDLRTPDGAGGWRPFCNPDPEGERLGFPLARPDDPARFSITCTAGAIGKCVRFGYAPWRPAAGGHAMAEYHAACVNLMRGDYGGADRPWTRNGMLVDVYDRAGIQRPEEGDDLVFEAGWTPAGAVCLAHPRVPENGSLEAIAAAHPQLAGHTGPEACTEASAAAAGALVFNRSRPPR